jgi:hypothetical protein
MAVKDARSVRAAQRSQILDGHRSGGYARQRVLSAWSQQNLLGTGATLMTLQLARKGVLL